MRWGHGCYIIYKNMFQYKSSRKTSGEGSSVAIALFNVQTRRMLSSLPRFLIYWRSTRATFTVGVGHGAVLTERTRNLKHLGKKRTSWRFWMKIFFFRQSFITELFKHIFSRTAHTVRIMQVYHYLLRIFTANIKA